MMMNLILSIFVYYYNNFVQFIEGLIFRFISEQTHFVIKKIISVKNGI